MPDQIQKVRELIKAKTPFVYIISDEERRVCEEIIQNIAKPMNREVWVWTCNTGLINHETKEDKKCKQFPEAVKEIIDMKVSEKKSGAIFLMLDPHIHINPSSARVIKDGYVNIMLGRHKDMIDNPRAYEGKVGNPKNIIFIAGRLAHVSNGIVEGLEPTIKTQVEVVDFPLPTKEELIDLINKFIASGKKIIKDANFDYSKEEVAEMARSLQGLSFLEAQRAINECLINEKKLSISRLLEKKRSLVKQDDILEVIWNPPSISEVGGLENLKEFAHMYRGQFSEEAEKYGIEPLRGLLFIGPPGCLRGDTPIHDPVDNTIKTVEERFDEGKEFNVLSLSKEGPVIARAEKPIKFKKEKMIEFTLEDGQKIAVTPAHRFWTQNGWKTSSEVFEQLQTDGVCLLPSNSELVQSINPNRKDTNLVRIIQAEFVEDAVYFDFHVPKYENYAACGLWHHNTGKSKSAKSISNLWNIPCLRLDIGKVMAGIVGQSEMRMRQVIKTAEAAAPCVTGDTKVLISRTKDGANPKEITISELYDKYHREEIGPVFYIKNGDNREVVECHGILRRHPGKNRIIEIETEEGNKIRVTENHKLRVIDKQGKEDWKEAKDLTIDDELVEVNTVSK